MEASPPKELWIKIRDPETNDEKGEVRVRFESAIEETPNTKVKRLRLGKKKKKPEQPEKEESPSGPLAIEIDADSELIDQEEEEEQEDESEEAAQAPDADLDGNNPNPEEEPHRPEVPLELVRLNVATCSVPKLQELTQNMDLSRGRVLLQAQCEAAGYKGSIVLSKNGVHTAKVCFSSPKNLICSVCVCVCVSYGSPFKFRGFLLKRNPPRTW